MVWIATIHLAIVMCVHQLDMQVSTNQTISYIDLRMKEGDFFCRPRYCKFLGGVVTVEVLERCSSGKMFFLQTNSVEAKRLAIRNQGFELVYLMSTQMYTFT